MRQLRAKHLSIFLENWYDEKELRELADRHLGHLKDQTLSFDKAMVLSKGLSQSRYLNTGQRATLIDLTVALEPDAVYAQELPRMHAIEKGDVSALNNLARLYYEHNTRKREALDFLKQYIGHRRDETRAKWLVILEIWNGIFESVQEKVEKVIKAGNEDDLGGFLTHLLYHEQQQLVLALFGSGPHGVALRERYELLYYAVRILTGRTEGNLLLRIPPEVIPTVQDIVAKVREKQAFYGGS